jgi:cytochrome c2
MRLGAEDRDVVQIGGNGQQLFQRAHACHSVANHDQFGFFI